MIKYGCLSIYIDDRYFLKDSEVKFGIHVFG